MEGHSVRLQFLSAGVPEDQIEIALENFYGLGGAPEITCTGDYVAAKSLYAVMDASVPPQDTHSAVARYVITLGARMTEWEMRNSPTSS